MGRYFAYMRISTQEERGKQKYSRQEKAIAKWCKENNVALSERRIYRDDTSGSSFNRPAWKELEADVQNGDTVIMKDICRFTREYEKGFEKYMDFYSRGIKLIIIDNPTVSTSYIQSMMDIADRQSNRIAKKSLRDTIELLLLVELDRAETERAVTVQRIKDGIAASCKKSGRSKGSLDKLTPELKEDIIRYLSDRSIKQIDILKKHDISRNTLKKYIAYFKIQLLMKKEIIYGRENNCKSKYAR